jgi:hypothetical protein
MCRVDQPSSVVRFEPRNGVLTEALVVVPFIVGPPLSLMNATSVFSVSFSSASFLVTAPMASSIALIMAAYVRRFSSSIAANFFSRGSSACIGVWTALNARYRKSGRALFRSMNATASRPRASVRYACLFAGSEPRRMPSGLM